MKLSSLMLAAAAGVALGTAAMGACSASSDPTVWGGTANGAPRGTGPGPGGASTGPGLGGDIGFDGGPDVTVCGNTCSTDLHSVVDCNGNLKQECTGTQGCDYQSGACINACDAAVNNKASVGCQYYATFMDQYNPGACIAAFVANTWNTPAHITVNYQGQSLPLANFARIPQGSGPSLTYQPFDPAAGIPPNEVVILFLSGTQGQPGPGQAFCPVPSAVQSGVMLAGQTGIASSFEIQSDVPVVAYEINPYGGGSAAVTAGSLLLPTSAWDTNYVAVNISENDIAFPSMNIVAMSDNTSGTMVPKQAVSGGGGLPSSPANTPMTFTLNKGQHAQFSQNLELTGSIIQSDKPVGFMAGQQCMRKPTGVFYCDHGEQMIPPVRALGSEYVGVMHRPRSGEPAIWRVIGAIDGTTLTYSTAVGGPAAINQGEAAEFITGTPFVVKSQDADHPFILLTYMSGSGWQMLQDQSGHGDPDCVLSVPPQQYMPQYTFFADPTYPETNLVLVRAKANGAFKDVNLDCAGVLSGWQPVGDYEWTRVDLITGNFQNVGNCSTGRHSITSDGPFGLWVWGWGTPNTTIFTANVSYGYPGGMNVQPINEVVIPPNPR